MKPVIPALFIFANSTLHLARLSNLCCAQLIEMNREKRIRMLFNSYFNEQVIDTFHSEINPLIEVALINGTYQLNAGSVNYSFGPLHEAFRKYFHKDPPSLHNDSKVLMLGLGAGSVVKILREEHELLCNITGVEVDNAVILAARKHFSLDKVAGLKVVVADALDFMEQCSHTYDLIVVDIYVDDKVPVQFETVGFIKHLARCLNPGGKVVFNKLQPVEDDESAVQALVDKFNHAFDNTAVVKVVVNKRCPNCFITGVKNKISSNREGAYSIKHTKQQ